MSKAGNLFIYLVRLLRLVLGLALVGLAVWGTQSEKDRDAQYGEAYQLLRDAAADGIPTVPADRMDPGYEGKFIRIQGNLEVGQAVDPLTGLALKAAGVARTLEMLQWKEERYKPRGMSSWSSRFEQVWSDKVIDSDAFQQKPLLGENKHVNPGKLPHETGRWFDSTYVKLGGWRLNPTYTDHLAKIQPMPFELLRNSLGSGWQVNPEGWVTPVNASSDVGAYRIRYEYLPIEEGIHSAVGLVRDGVVTDNLRPAVHSLPLIAAGEVSSDTLVQATLDRLDQGMPPHNWAGYLFAGLLLCIGVAARSIPFLKSYTEAPWKRRALISIALATIGATAFRILV